MHLAKLLSRSTLVLIPFKWKMAVLLRGHMGVQDNLYFFCNVFNTAFKFQQAVITNKKISSGYFIFIPFMWKSYKLIVLVKLGPDLTSYLQLVCGWLVWVCMRACVHISSCFRHAARLAHVYLCIFFLSMIQPEFLWLVCPLPLSHSQLG